MKLPIALWRLYGSPKVVKLVKLVSPNKNVSSKILQLVIKISLKLIGKQNWNCDQMKSDIWFMVEYGWIYGWNFMIEYGWIYVIQNSNPYLSLGGVAEDLQGW